MKKNLITELDDGLFCIKGEGRSSHTYVIRGESGNLLIDSGLDSNFPFLKENLLKIGIRIKDIFMIINTHEHFDHIGANRYFQEHAIISAHRFAANKIKYNDQYVTLYKSGDRNQMALRVHLWLESKSRIDLGNYSLDIIHTPGHTSGSICIYEPIRKYLFTGDTLFAGGTLSYIAESGSVGDYINSIQSLNTRKIEKIFPGHGAMSDNPGADLERAYDNAMKFLNSDDRIEVTYTETE